MIKRTVARATAVALLATGGLTTATAAAMAGENDGSPGGSGFAPMSDDYRQGPANLKLAHHQSKTPWNANDWEGADKVAPMGDGDRAAPMGDGSGSPGGAGIAPMGDSDGSPSGGLAPMGAGDGSPGGGLAPMGDDHGAPGGTLAPLGESDGSPTGRLAPTGDDHGSPGGTVVAPMGDNAGSPTSGLAPAYDDAIINTVGALTDGDGVQDTMAPTKQGTSSPGGGIAPMGDTDGAPGGG